ncbi:ribbon-helix-helix protein, CopG family [Candidatus Pacearchaeota archaeon]|nr:ribbon-helix-helix protein, CopG family [Candidatus Pacearchaeota archaeon]
MRVRYVNISITEDLAKKIDEYVKKTKQGYRSRAEFISEAIRLRLGIIKSKKKS